MSGPLGIISLICAIFMLMGNRNGKAGHYMPWLVFSAIIFVLDLILLVLELILLTIVLAGGGEKWIVR
ncbi:hypothetical protein M3Y99_00121900 [Aphelenchoides fujianensis]|nr:hypothetical protein M3Y99_00121900 [Aphelenchoides fujianensis]